MPATTRPRPGHDHLLRRVRTALIGVALAAAAGLTGLATTAAWPTTVTAGQYAAEVSLSADPHRSATVHAPTVFGDLDIDFSSPVPAPGIDAGVQVRDSIASVLASSGVDIRSLQPSGAELDAALWSAAWRIGAKVVLGIAVSMALAWLILRRRHAWLPLGAGLTSAALLAASLAGTYRSQSFTAVRTTGLLSLVRANSGLLGDVEKRSAEATPYVRNMLALTAALQEKYSPSEIASPGSLKIIAVSDIHGANQYPLLKSLVRSEGATAVIDSGDLVNFGTVQEAQASGIFAGIQSLGVPYLFVRGNHDADSPTDDALVQRLRAIPNVIVLEPKREHEYTLASIGGLRIAGFGDPRWFGDGGQNTAEAQKPAVAAFRSAANALKSDDAVPAAVRDEPFDLLVGHEPSAVQGLADLARVRLNGHLHAQSLDGSRIALGSFTGGGVVSHYIQSGDGTELAGQPFAFDILTYAPTCRLSSLTRYQFTNLLEGRPTYDSVQVLNGTSIESSTPAQGRSCSNLEPTRRWTFTVPTPTSDASSPTATPSVTASLPGGSPTPTVTETHTP